MWEGGVKSRRVWGGEVLVGEWRGACGAWSGGRGGGEKRGEGGEVGEVE